MIKIENKIEFENSCWVGEVDASLFNLSEEARIKAVTDLASITTGRLGLDDTCDICDSGKALDLTIDWLNCDECGRSVEIPNISNRRYKIYKRLLIESAGKPSVPFEFVPQIEWEDDKDWNEKFFNNYMKYGHYVPMSGGLFKTNLRNTENFNIEPDAEELKDYSGFKIIVGQVPWKVISHLRTHRAFSFLVESSRNKRYLKDVEFWYPSWWEEYNMEETRDDDLTITEEQLFKIKTGKRIPEEATMELSDRRLVKFAMCAWKQDKNAWNNLFEVRGKGTGTQSITGITVDNIKKLVYDRI